MGNEHGSHAIFTWVEQPKPTDADLQSIQATLQSIASPTVSLGKECAQNLQTQIEDMKQIKANNEKSHGERMDAMSKSNLKQKDTRQALYDSESEAQRHRNADNEAANAKKVSDLSCANENKMAAQRNANESEVVEMHSHNEQGRDEHNAWMLRLRAQNNEEMTEMEKDGDENLRGMKQRGREDKARNEKECAANQTKHNADMAVIEQKHQTDLTTVRQHRAENLARHKLGMAALSVEHKHETDEMERRQRNAVDALSKDNNAKAATQATKMNELKGRNQSKMDCMCALMRQIDELEAQIANSTERFFALAEKVEDERATMRSFEELTRLTQSVLAAQMEHIRCVREEMAASQRKAEKVTTEGSVKELLKVFKTLMAEQDRTRRRMSRHIDAFEKANAKLLAKYKQILESDARARAKGTKLRTSAR